MNTTTQRRPGPAVAANRRRLFVDLPAALLLGLVYNLPAPAANGPAVVAAGLLLAVAVAAVLDNGGGL